MPQAASTRWCPTPEQLMILEEMYRGGIRTPNASQIQQITAHLSFYGKIEGKNVFYWFQNHKARDRQKLRRRLSRQQQLLLQQQQQQQQAYHHQQLETSPLFIPNQNPSHFLRQEGREERGDAAAAAQVMNYSCILETCEEGRKEKQQAMAACAHQDWMQVMMMDHLGPSPYYKPLKTLQLFPVNSTNGALKEESSSSSSNNYYNSCSTSTN